MKTTRRITAIVLVGAALAGCSGSKDDDRPDNDVPISWIRSTYSSHTSGYLDRTDAPSVVAGEIHTNTASRDRKDIDGRVFLRYDDDIVAVTKVREGTLIEVDDYRTGYQRHYTQLRYSSWPDPATQQSFRGGGPGSGK